MLVLSPKSPRRQYNSYHNLLSSVTNSEILILINKTVIAADHACSQARVQEV